MLALLFFIIKKKKKSSQIIRVLQVNRLFMLYYLMCIMALLMHCGISAIFRISKCFKDGTQIISINCQRNRNEPSKREIIL